ncbi:MAG: DUF420 domain-containing protein [Verrucomicrobiota bacterium]
MIELLPAWNAGLNTVATILLTLGFYFIKTGRKLGHRRCMISAFCVSAVFLVGYLLHKYLKQAAGLDMNTTFAGQGFWRVFYYTMLISHLILAMAIVPMILMTMIRALKGDHARHRKIAVWTFPMWYYVSVTGVLIYFFLYQWFPETSS